MASSIHFLVLSLMCVGYLVNSVPLSTGDSTTTVVSTTTEESDDNSTIPDLYDVKATIYEIGVVIDNNTDTNNGFMKEEIFLEVRPKGNSTDGSKSGAEQGKKAEAPPAKLASGDGKSKL